MDLLRSSLLDLLYELREANFPLIVGGGFGLYLKRLDLNAAGARTLFSELPYPRATNDLDLFIRVELLADHGSMQQMAHTLRRLKYEVVPEAKFLQWKRTLLVAGVPQEVKVDFLVGPLGSRRASLHIKRPRVRPKQPIDLHAYSVEEALGLEDEPQRVAVDGMLTNGEPYQGAVFVPHPFPYLLMKLSAFSDRRDDNDRDLGRHHALDVYTLVGLLTEPEYERSRELGALHRASPHVTRAARIVASDFSTNTDLGMLRLREHPLYRPDFRLAEMAQVLREIFAASE